MHAAECSQQIRQAYTGRTRTRIGDIAQQALGRQVPTQAGGPSRATATEPAWNLQRDDAHEVDVGGGERAAPQVHEHHHQRRAEDQARHHQRRALPARAAPQHLTGSGSQCGAATPASCPARARCASAPHQIRLTVWRGTTSAVPCPCALRLSTSQDQADSVPASPSHHATTPCTLPAQLKAHRAAPQLCVLNRRNFQSAHASTCVPCRTHQERSHAEEHHPHKVWRPTAVDILLQFYAVLHTAEALPTQHSVNAHQQCTQAQSAQAQCSQAQCTASSQVNGTVGQRLRGGALTCTQGAQESGSPASRGRRKERQGAIPARTACQPRLCNKVYFRSFRCTGHQGSPRACAGPAARAGQ